MRTVLNNLKKYYNYIYERAVEIIGGETFLILKTSDSEIYIYNDMDNTMECIHNVKDLDLLKFSLNLSAQLRKQMSKKGYTTKQLADELSIRESTLSRYLKGQATPSFYVIDRIATCLDCSPNDLRYTGKVPKINLHTLGM